MWSHPIQVGLERFDSARRVLQADGCELLRTMDPEAVGSNPTGRRVEASRSGRGLTSVAQSGKSAYLISLQVSPANIAPLEYSTYFEY